MKNYYSGKIYRVKDICFSKHQIHLQDSFISVPLSNRGPILKKYLAFKQPSLDKNIYGIRDITCKDGAFNFEATAYGTDGSGLYITFTLLISITFQIF